MEDIQRAQHRAEDQAKEEKRMREEFTRDMKVKFEQERKTYQKQLSQLEEQLRKEQGRLKTEGQDDDADDLSERLLQLQTLRSRCAQPQQQTRRIFLWPFS